MFPLFIPIYSHHEPEKCPNCGKPEDKMEVCRNCTHIYTEPVMTFPLWYVSLILDIVIFYAVFYVLDLDAFMWLSKWWMLPTIFLVVAVGLVSCIAVWPLFGKEVIKK